MIGNSWNEKKRDGISKMLGRMKPDMPLAKRIEDAKRRLEEPVSKLRAIDERLRIKDEQFLKKIVSAQRNRNDASANMYANELVQVRKMRGRIKRAKISMEQIQTRLDTISDLGDVVVTLSPAMSLIRDLNPKISGMVPDAASSMQDFTEIVRDLMDKSNMQTGDAMTPTTSESPDVRAVMDEAYDVVSQQTSAIIPDVPQDFAMTGVGERLPEAPAGAPRQQLRAQRTPIDAPIA